MMKKPCGISYRERFVAILSVLLFSGVLLCGCGSVEGSVAVNGSQEMSSMQQADSREESSLQAGSSTERPEQGLVETKDEAQGSSAGVNTEQENGQETGSTGNMEGGSDTENAGEITNIPEEIREPVPGKCTIGNLLLTAKEPLGSTMYIWGGGWNEADTEAGEEARTLGVSSRWAEFAAMQGADYDYNKTRYQIHDGLDCSGYVGWVIYNVLESENGKDGYVMGSTAMAEKFAGRGFGAYTPVGQVSDWKAGDIMSMKGHVWIAMGACEDGSVVLLHASPPGVILCGTNLADGSKSQAVLLAEKYMSSHYPEWYAKYPECSRPYSYLTSSASMRWSREVLSDEDGLADMSAGEVLKWLFDENQ